MNLHTHSQHLLRRSGIMLLLAAVALGMFAGCTSSSGGGSTTTKTTKRGGGARASIEATVKFTISNVGSRNKQVAGITPPRNMACTRSIPSTCNGVLSCPAKPDSKWEWDACAYLTSHRAKLFIQELGDVMCTEQYGGPEVARITGTVKGKPVRIKLTRTDGCHINQWSLHAPLWGQPA